MLDIAHSVFNVVTGVPLHEERDEIRAFRSVLAWREIIEAAGFVDTMVYEVQPDDPTVDEMMCFYKPPFTHYGPRTDLAEIAEVQIPPPPPLVPILTNLLQQIPATALDVLRNFIEGMINNLPSLSTTISEYVASSASSGVAHVVNQMVERITSEVKTWLERFRPFIESSDHRDGDDLSLSFLPPEAFLIVPALNKRVATGKATPMEMVAAAFLHDIQAAFAMETSSSKDTKPDEAKQPSVVLSPRSLGFTTSDVINKLELLLRVLPQLKEPSILDEIEVPALAQRAVRSLWAAQEYEATSSSSSSSSSTSQPPHRLLPIAETATKYLDSRAWQELSAALDEIIKHKAAPPTVRAIIDAATNKEKLAGKDRASMWARALVAILGSPLVYINRTMVFQLKMVGLDTVYKAWSQAQKRRESDGKAKDSEVEAHPLTQALKPFTEPQTMHAVMRERHFVDVHNVAEVISATYGYTSLTARPVDVTKIIAKRLKDHTLLLADLPPKKLQRERESIPGWDGLRKAVTLNSSELKIRYRPVLETDPSYQRKVDELLYQLSDAGLVKPLHRNDGHLTWYKLPEWMQVPLHPLHLAIDSLHLADHRDAQVEITQIFGQSMEHTPWYRFPFMSFISLYFQIFLKEVGIVRSEHGLAKALLSNAFLTDLVPGVVMFLLCGQLQLLALPVRSVCGDDYTPELMVEQLVVLVPTKSGGKLNWEELDERISAQQVVDDEGLYVLTVPTFKPLTEILIKMASRLPQSQVLEISNQQVVQAKVLLPATADADEAEAALLAKLGQINGCKVMFHYRFPVDGTPSRRPRLCVSVRVSTLSLIRFINTCAALDIRVEQVYDFYT